MIKTCVRCKEPLGEWSHLIDEEIHLKCKQYMSDVARYESKRKKAHRWRSRKGFKMALSRKKRVRG